MVLCYPALPDSLSPPHLPKVLGSIDSVPLNGNMFLLTYRPLMHVILPFFDSYFAIITSQSAKDLVKLKNAFLELKKSASTLTC